MVDLPTPSRDNNTHIQCGQALTTEVPVPGLCTVKKKERFGSDSAAGGKPRMELLEQAEFSLALRVHVKVRKPGAAASLGYINTHKH